MDGVFPPRTPDDERELRRRRRSRNIALLLALIATIALFYAISVVKFKVH